LAFARSSTGEDFADPLLPREERLTFLWLLPEPSKDIVRLSHEISTLEINHFTLKAFSDHTPAAPLQINNDGLNQQYHISLADYQPFQ
jgi:hypothetical protein